MKKHGTDTKDIQRYMRWIEQRKFVQSVNRNHPLPTLPNTLDWQDSVIGDFHNEFYKKELEIDQAEANAIVRKISQKWSLRIEQLYPANSSNMKYSWGSALGPRHGVIWIDSDMMYPSYVLHELAHVVVECFIDYDLKGKSKLREEGHGILYSSVLYHWLEEYYQDDSEALKCLNNWFDGKTIHMVPKEIYLHMQKLFKKRILM